MFMTLSDLQKKKTVQLTALFNAGVRDLAKLSLTPADRALIRAMLARIDAELARRGPSS